MNPILIAVPMPLTTQRLIIRPLELGDGPDLNEAIRESFAALHQWVPWAKTLPSVDDTQDYVCRSMAQWVMREDLRLLLIDKRNGRIVGSTGLHRMNWQVPKFEIGYWCRTSEEGHGYIGEAVTALTQYAFAQLHAKRVEIRCDTRNIRSKNVAIRLGYVLESTIKFDSVSPSDGSLRDTDVFVRFNAVDLPDVDATWTGSIFDKEK